MKTFKAKVSYGLLIPIILLMAFQIAWLLMAYVQLTFGAYIIIGVLVMAIIFTLLLFLKTEYSIYGDVLLIKSGLVFKTEININTIRTIRKSRNLLASPAPSLDRLEIAYGKFDSILISPLKKEDFVHAVKAINNKIESDIA